MSVADFTGVDAIRSISRELRGQPLHQRVAAERHDPGDVLVRLGGERLAHVRERLLAALRAHGVGQVDDEHDREPVDREHELEPGEREHEGGQQPDPDRERRAPRGPRRGVGVSPRGAGRRARRAAGAGGAPAARRSVMPISAPRPVVGALRRPSRAAMPRRSRASVSRS